MEIIHIRDPIHGFVSLNEYEKRIVDSRPFQRLRNIKQLALTSLVYPGATHTRFEHSIGVMHLVTEAFNSATCNTVRDVYNLSDSKKAVYRQILRLIALTHDLGHAPYSHASEELFPVGMTHEDYSEQIVCKTEIAEIINEISEIYSKQFPDVDICISPKLICDIYLGREAGPNSEYTFLKSFMDGELDCDKMDYVLRDSYYCGVKYGNFDKDRLLESLTIYVSDDIPRLAIKRGGLQAVEEFILARYFMFLQVYFHKTRRSFDISLAMALKEVLPNSLYPENINEYLAYDDCKVFELMKANRDNCKACRCVVDRVPLYCAFSTEAHPNQSDKREFTAVFNELRTVIEEENLVKDYSRKLPHKIPRKNDFSEENAIIIYDSNEERVRNIAECSEIIEALTNKINIQRIYCYPEERNKAINIIKKHNIMFMEE